jgi:hypothetical protein
VVAPAHRAAAKGGPGPELERHNTDDVAIEYLGEAPVLVRGPASGRPYTFSPWRRIGRVSPEDAEALAERLLFRRGPQAQGPEKPRRATTRT